MLAQIGGIPGEVEVRSKEEAEIAEGDEPQIGLEENSLPGSGELGGGRRLYASVRLEAADAGQFRAIDAFVILGKVAIKQAEGHGPHNAQRAEDVKNRAPTEGEQNAAGNKWGDGNGEAAEEMRRARDAAAFDARKPELHAAAGNSGFRASNAAASRARRISSAASPLPSPHLLPAAFCSPSVGARFFTSSARWALCGSWPSACFIATFPRITKASIARNWPASAASSRTEA